MHFLASLLVFCSYGMLVMITTVCDRHLGLVDLDQMGTQQHGKGGKKVTASRAIVSTMQRACFHVTGAHLHVGLNLHKSVGLKTIFKNKTKQDGQVLVHYIKAHSCNHCCHWKGNYYTFWGHVCKLSYSAYNAQMPYCHLQPVQLYNIFRMMS